MFGRRVDRNVGRGTGDNIVDYYIISGGTEEGGGGMG